MNLKQVVRWVIVALIFLFGYLLTASVWLLFFDIRFVESGVNILYILVVISIPFLVYLKFSKRFGKIKTSLLAVLIMFLVPIIFSLLLLWVSTPSGYDPGMIPVSKACDCLGIPLVFVPKGFDVSNSYGCIGKVSNCKYYGSDPGGALEISNLKCYSNNLEFEFRRGGYNKDYYFKEFLVPTTISLTVYPNKDTPYQLRVNPYRRISNLSSEKIIKISENKLRIILDEESLPNSRYRINFQWPPGVMPDLDCVTS